MEPDTRTLWDLAREGVDRVEVRCGHCERAGAYGVPNLIERYGKGYGLPDLLVEISRDCPKRASVWTFDRCGAIYQW